MTDHEAMKMALSKFEHLWEIGIDVEYKVELLPEIRALRQAIEADMYRNPDTGNSCKGYVHKTDKESTLQEPVAWITPDGEGFRMRLEPPVNDVPLGWKALYTAPPPKPWVGLTVEEIKEILYGLLEDDRTPMLTLIDVVQEKLKEKNT